MTDSSVKTVVIAGGTGMVGTALASELLNRQYRVIILSRKKGNGPAGLERLQYAQWDPSRRFIEEAVIREADFIVNLAGAGVAEKRWTEARKKEIVESRVKSSETIIEALKSQPNKVRTVVNASAIGWYGPDTPQSRIHPFEETAPADLAFLGETVRLWEQSIEPVSSLVERLVILRIGIVLSSEGGALAEFIKPMKFGIAPVMGNGRQMVSWIHVSDLCRMIIHALENNTVNGVYNAVSPYPVSNRQLVQTLADVKPGIQLVIPVPAFVLKIMLGEMSIEVLKSATVSSEKIRKTGFVFQYPRIREAVQEILAR